MVSTGERHHIASGGRYPVLRTIAILFMVAAVLSLCYGVYQAICVLANWTSLESVPVAGNFGSRLSACFVWLAATFFAIILNIGIAEVIKLFMDVEPNTRMTAMNTAVAPMAPLGATAPAVRVPDGSRLTEETAEGALLRGR